MEQSGKSIMRSSAEFNGGLLVDGNTQLNNGITNETGCTGITRHRFIRRT